jgi:hypothetical protein
LKKDKDLEKAIELLNDSPVAKANAEKQLKLQK